MTLSMFINLIDSHKSSGPRGIEVSKSNLPCSEIDTEADNPRVIETRFYGEEQNIFADYWKSKSDRTSFYLFKAEKKKNFQLASVIPVVLVCYAISATRFSLERFGTDSLLFALAFATYLLVSVIFSSFVIAHSIIAFTPKSRRVHASYVYSVQYIMHGYMGRIEDVLGVLGTVLNGLYLLARVHAGQCDDLHDIWSTQFCNPVGTVNFLPPDQVLILYAMPLCCQVLLRGITLEAVTFCWIAIIFFVLYSLFVVNGMADLWTLLYSIIFMNISYEIERFYRIMHIQCVNLKSAGILHARSELKMHEEALESDRKLKEKEMSQLRSLMGNVAHDLKTPLHSIEADLEVLQLFVSKIPDGVVGKISEEFRKRCSGDVFDPRSICESLRATCKFMGMAINRSQDFMRASNGISLVPTIETFELKAAVAISVACINQLQTARYINVHPLNEDICSHITSDKHWLSENVLCLISNALKFSESGIIDVRVDIIKSTIKKSASWGMLSLPLHKSYSDKLDVSISKGQPYTLEVGSDGTPPQTTDGPEAVLITVQDEGIGISLESRKKLFEPLSQTKRMAGGAGLGLFCLSKRTEALGGTAGVTSRMDGGQGSMFWFTFPHQPDFVAAKAEVYIETAFLDEIDVPIYLTESKHVLVVDDSLSILKVTNRLLQINGHTAETATNGAIGLEMLKAALRCGDFDMVLTDLQMPVMDGMEATVLFREFETKLMEEEERLIGGCNRKRMLIVGMSATTDDDTRRLALISGMDYFIPKPFAYKDLQRLLSGVNL